MTASALPQTYGAFSRGRKTAAGGTPFVQTIYPCKPQKAAWEGTGTPVNPKIPAGTIHVTDFVYIVPTTAHLITIMRPLNWTTVSAAAVAAQAVLNITADPGNYATNYKYPLPNGQTVPSTANNLIAANDYVVYQTTAGQWVTDTVASVSGLAITMTTNIPTGGVSAGATFYWFGISTDTDPTYNEAHQQFDILQAASNTAPYTLQSPNGLWQAYHEGDPMIFYSSNATTAGFIELIAGYYARH